MKLQVWFERGWNQRYNLHNFFFLLLLFENLNYWFQKVPF